MIYRGPTNRRQFKDYCLRRLGAPVVEINVDDEQVEDRIDDALQYYWDYHFDGTEKIHVKHVFTQDQIDKGIIEIPENIIGIVNIYNINTSAMSTGMFSLRYQIAMNDLYSLAKIQIGPYQQAMQSIEMMDEMFSQKIPFRFNRHSNRVYLDSKLSDITVAGNYLVMEVYVMLDPELHNNVWKDRWLQRYATTLIKRQWGDNLKKFEGIEMLNGITFSGQKIYEEAVEEITKLESEMLGSYSLPPSIMIG